jgi:hypothetical protein
MDISKEDIENFRAHFGAHLTDDQAREEIRNWDRMLREIRKWFEENPHAIQWPSWLRDPRQVQLLKMQLLGRVNSKRRLQRHQVDGITRAL